MSGPGNGEGAFYLVEGASGATTYYTPSDAGDALYSFIQTLDRVAPSWQFIVSIWPDVAPPPEGGGGAPGWLIEVRKMGSFAGYLCDGRTSGPHTFPRGRQERLSGTNDWENLTKTRGNLFVVWVKRTAESDAVAPHVGHDADKAFTEAVAWANQGHHRVWIDGATITTGSDVLACGVYRDGRRVTS